MAKKGIKEIKEKYAESGLIAAVKDTLSYILYGEHDTRFESDLNKHRSRLDEFQRKEEELQLRYSQIYSKYKSVEADTRKSKRDAYLQAVQKIENSFADVFEAYKTGYSSAFQNIKKGFIQLR